MGFLREFLTKWTFDVDDKPLDKMNEKLGTIGERMENLGNAFGKLGEKAAHLGIAIAAIGAAVGGSFLLTKNVAELGNELAKTSQKLGISVEMLQKLRYAAELSDVSIGDLDTGLKLLSKNMDATDSATSAQAKAFAQLGVRARFANGELRPTTEVFADLAEAFKTMPDGAQKTAAAMQLFGRSGAQLIPMLNEGKAGLASLFAEAEAFGLITAESAKASEEWLDGMTRVWNIVKRLGEIIGTTLVPVFAEITEQVREWFMANRELIKTNVAEFADKVATGLRILWNVTVTTLQWIDRLALAMGGWESTLNKLQIAFTALAGGTMLYLIGAFVQALFALGGAIAAVGVKAAVTQAIIFAIPIAIGAAVVAIGLLIEDIMTFFQGGESFFGDFIKSIQDNMDTLKSVFKAVGSVFIEVILWPIRNAIEGLNGIIKLLTGVNILGKAGFKFGEEGKKQREGMLDGAANWLAKPIQGMKLDDKNRLISAQSPITNPNGEQSRGLFSGLRPMVAPASSSAGPVTITNDITVNANGLDKDAATQAIKSAIVDNDMVNRKQAGKYSQRKYKE